jgi:hypothetical protein
MTVVEETTLEDTLEPVVVEPVTLILKLNKKEKLRYTQQPLSFFGKMELFSVLSGALQKALSSEGGLSLSAILDVPNRAPGEALSANDFLDADQFVSAVATLLQYAPDLLMNIYCISLKVPRQERELVKRLMEDQITDEQGVKMIEVFIDQNWEVMRSFFFEQIMPLVEKVTKTVQSSAPSTQ